MPGATAGASRTGHRHFTAVSQGGGIVGASLFEPRATMPRPFALAASALQACAIAAAFASTSALAQTAYPATLAGHAVLPALSFIPAPQDAPADLQRSGKFT